MINEEQAKQKAQIEQGLVGGPVRNIRRFMEPRELRIEQLEGGFVVLTADASLGNYTRQVVPNADCLVSFLQKWVGEGQQGG